MAEDYSKLTNEEIDRLIAERVMGWKKNAAGWWIAEIGEPHHECDWHPSTDHNDVALVRAEIERRRLQLAYIEALVKIVAPTADWLHPDSIGLPWAQLNATPRQQCEAALVIREFHDE